MGSIVTTRCGDLEGREDAARGVLVFRGIPYAAPAGGARRLRPPEPCAAWSGVRDAGAFGPSAPQNAMMIPLPGSEVGHMAEDCLALNVWTPAADGGRRPVMVWIHGGGFVIGSGAQPIFDGAALARRGDVVVVTLNYRLGPLGFLFLDDLCPGFTDTANLGLRDQIAALRWVRENVDAFGGDPGNVTIFGESAGGMSVGTLLGMPASRGLYRRAIAQSGAAHHVHSRETASRTAARFLERLGVAPADAFRKLPEIPAETLVRVQSQIFFESARSEAGLLPFQPVVDGESLPQPPLEAVRRGAVAEVSLLTGTTRDEWKLFGLLDPDARGLDEAGLRKRLESRLRDVDVGALLETYRRAREGRAATDPLSLFFAIETDRIFRIPAIRLAEAQCSHQEQTFCYRFDWASPLFDGRLGACHAIELPFMFGNLELPGLERFIGSGPEVAQLAERSMDAWLQLARSGAPGHAGLPEPWPAYDEARRATFVLDREPRVEEAPEDAERAFWDGLV